MPRQQKSQATSSRAAFGSSAYNNGFGAGGTTGFGSSSSAISYLAEQPDLSLLSDPNIVVSFKNLSKKDSTTKARALDELQTYVVKTVEKQSHLEDAFIEAWVKVYPRASIDLFRRVRQTAHAIQGKISAASGKRIAKHMSALAPSWLAGTHDGDKAVVRTAQAALNETFPTSEKQLTLKKAFHSSVLNYCSNAVTYENAKTLSDERSTSAEDAAALYARVVSSSLASVTDLIETLDQDELQKQRDLYSELVESDQVWALAASKDTATRRALMRLLKAYIVHFPDLIDASLSTIAKSLLSKQTMRHQSGSALQYAELLLLFTRKDPTIWAQDVKGKLSSEEKLVNLVKYGSHAGPPQFWSTVKAINGILPAAILPSDVPQGTKLLEALKSGFTSKDEPRANYTEAMDCYLMTMDRIVAAIPEEAKTDFVTAMGFPISQEYVKPNEQSSWRIPAATSLKVIETAVSYDCMKRAVEKKWPCMADDLIARMKSSLPEQAKDFDSSQREVEGESTRFFQLQYAVLKSKPSSSLRAVILQNQDKVVQAATEQLEARNGKPYGSAACILAAMDNQKRSGEVQPTSQMLSSFVDTKLPELVLSPSGDRLIAVLYQSNGSENFGSAWSKTANFILSQRDSQTKAAAVQKLLTSRSIPSGFTMAKEHAELQHYILRQAEHELDDATELSFSATILDQASNVLPESIAIAIISHLSKNLQDEERRSVSLSALEQASRHNRNSLRAFLVSPDGPDILQNLLFVQESGNEADAAIAKKLNEALHAISSSDAAELKGLSAQAVLQRGLYEANENSLSIATLVDYAAQQVDASARNDIAAMLPDVEIWREKLNQYLETSPVQSSAVTDDLGGVVLLASQELARHTTKEPEHDPEGLTPLMRMAMFTSNFLSRSTDVIEHTAKLRDVFCELTLTSILANEQLSNDITSKEKLWIQADDQTTEDVIDFVSQVKSLINAALKQDLRLLTGKKYTQWPECFTATLWRGIDAPSPARAYRYARAFSAAVSQAVEEHGYAKESITVLEDDAKSLRKGNNALQFAAFVTAFQSPLTGTAGLTRMVNEIISELTAPAITSRLGDLMRSLVFMNIIIKDHEDALDSVAKQRLIFFAKNIIPTLISEDASEATKAEICRALCSTYPQILDIYGEFWQESLEVIQNMFKNSRKLSHETAHGATVSLIHAALKLFGTLRSLTFEEEANDDLKDSWVEQLPSLSAGLISLVKSHSAVSDESNQALRITNELLARLVAANPPASLENRDELFALLSADSRAIQQIAYSILHEQIPKAQEDVSLAAALDKKTASLPEELLSLVISEPPQVDTVGNGAFERRIPPALLTYLSAWLLVFDHFRNASDKVKTDYTAQLKEGAYLDGLLTCVFGMLGVSRARPVDATRFEPTSYSFDVESDPKRDAQWLLVHLYYLSLKRVPSLTKAWLVDLAPRQTRTQAEPWTEKHFSPLIIADALDAATAWARTQNSATDGLEVRTNPRAHEVRASRVIDEQTLAIAVRLPPNFPLGQVVVEGVQRVAVDEKRWRSWLLNTAGVIAFSDNSIAEGLLAFERNVSGQMRGQTECAICYSIVGQDRSLPNRKCHTCRNAFHGSCLYRWFRSSNSSSCPLCRTPFHYGKEGKQ